MRSVTPLQANPAIDVAQPRRWIRVKELAKTLTASEPTVWRWAREKRIPAPVKLGPRLTAWDSNAIDAWMAKKASEASA
ncbi:helix-turn-helix transcriptional regulator [Piscinibacter gummiphilus]|uniref:AlpA family phage regulatory protein n=1 Tax=Piscinibacter gummiphilus TaxID=946333 RepID=A0ABZ0D0K1_9BURK|nr:AlpA family phage regulatory protein [Piscinibacter gummiphilus]WOB10765.1 AlpA family phage regulatory protein [Piscinibacter gummiphilus]